MRALLLFGLLLLPQLLTAQSNFRRFFRLSGPEKCWTLTHPFKAGKAFRLTTEVRHLIDSLQQQAYPDSFSHGGKLDAFRHAYWMAILTRNIGHRAARKLGNAHEKGNYKLFRKNIGEDGVVQDSSAVVMDLHNNQIGIQYAITHPDATPSSLQQLLLNALSNGELLILQRNNHGQLQRCDGSIPSTENRSKQQWNLGYCIISSNQP
jgi:hypothetical protein